MTSGKPAERLRTPHVRMGVGMTYRMNIKPVDELIDIPAGTNVMVDGPAMIGKGVFARNIAYASMRSGQAAVIISAKETANDIIRWYEAHGVDMPALSAHWGIIDCVSYSLKIPDEREADTPNVKYIDGTVNLTKIIYHLEKMVVAFRARGTEEVVVVIDSLSVFLMYLPLQPLFTFLHILTGKVREWGGFSVAIIDSDMHDHQALSTLKQVFHGVIELRFQGEETAVRAVGLSASPTPWFRFKRGPPSVKGG